MTYNQRLQETKEAFGRARVAAKTTSFPGLPPAIGSPEWEAATPYCDVPRCPWPPRDIKRTERAA